MRLAFALAALLATSSASAQGVGTLAGTVLEDDGVTTVIGASVRIEGTTLGAATDIDGNYRIIGVPVGTYTVTASYAGYTSQTQAEVDINTGTARRLNFTLGMGPFPDWVCMGGYEPPLIARGPFAARIILGDEFEEVSNEPCAIPWPRVFWGDA